MKSKKNWLQKNLDFLESEEFKVKRELQKKKLESYAVELLSPMMDSKEMKEALEKDFKELILKGNIDPENNEVYSNGSIKAKFIKLK